jgi:hypothetical protein
MTHLKGIRRVAWSLGSLAALVGAVCLLMADSTNVCDIDAPLVVTYDVVTTCDGGHSGQVTLTSGNSMPDYSATVQVVSGDITFNAVSLYGGCQAGDAQLTEINFELPVTGGTPVSCLVATGQFGTAVDCGTAGCTIQVTPVQ